jgi:hypothetical protein
MQEVEAPRFQDNRHMKVVRSALHTGRLYPRKFVHTLLDKRSWVSSDTFMMTAQVITPSNNKMISDKWIGGCGRLSCSSSRYHPRNFFILFMVYLTTLSFYCSSMILDSKPGSGYLMCKANNVIGMTVICMKIVIKWNCLKSLVCRMPQGILDERLPYCVT